MIKTLPSGPVGMTWLQCVEYIMLWVRGSVCRFSHLVVLSQQEEFQAQALPGPPPLSSAERKQRWEQGQADYMGMDSFDNIEKKLAAFLK